MRRAVIVARIYTSQTETRSHVRLNRQTLVRHRGHTKKVFQDRDHRSDEDVYSSRALPKSIQDKPL